MHSTRFHILYLAQTHLQASDGLNNRTPATVSSLYKTGGEQNRAWLTGIERICMYVHRNCRNKAALPRCCFCRCSLHTVACCIFFDIRIYQGPFSITPDLDALQATIVRLFLMETSASLFYFILEFICLK